MLIENAIHSQQVYDPTDDSIMAEQELCMERLYDYNHTRPSEHTKRTQLLKEMLAECGAGCWIEPPFHPTGVESTFTWAIMSMPTSG